MNFLGNQLPGDDPSERYKAIGYRLNPFPTQGQVDGDVYVQRPELHELQEDLGLFLRGRPQGSVWAVQGAIGYGKSNFLKAVQTGIREGIENKSIARTAYRFVPSLALTPRRVVEEILLGIGEPMIAQLVERGPTANVQEHLRSTDYGRFWSNVRATSSGNAAQFLIRWLSGQQTYKAERVSYGITARERLPPAVAFPYLRALMDMFEEAEVLSRLVILLDEFEDIERLSKSEQTEYVQVVKTLLNAFNWRGLYVIIAGQAAAFTTIAENYPSLASRWRSVSLLPVQNPDQAVTLANAYKEAAALKPSSKLPPSDVDIKSAHITLFEKHRIVSQRMLLSNLHEWVERAAAPKTKG